MICLVPFGWIVLLVFLASEGDQGWNQYGPPPGVEPVSAPPPGAAACGNDDSGGGGTAATGGASGATSDTGSTTGATSETGTTGSATITMKSFRFHPNTITVSGPTELTLTNEDSVAHTFTLDDLSFTESIPRRRHRDRYGGRPGDDRLVVHHPPGADRDDRSRLASSSRLSPQDERESSGKVIGHDDISRVGAARVRDRDRPRDVLA